MRQRWHNRVGIIVDWIPLAAVAITRIRMRVMGLIQGFMDGRIARCHDEMAQCDELGTEA